MARVAGWPVFQAEFRVRLHQVRTLDLHAANLHAAIRRIAAAFVQTEQNLLQRIQARLKVI
jgi:hypothetical protein